MSGSLGFHFFSGAAGGPGSGLRGSDAFRLSMLDPYAGFGFGTRRRAGIGSRTGLRFGRLHFSFMLQLAERGEGAFEDAAETGFVAQGQCQGFGLVGQRLEGFGYRAGRIGAGGDGGLGRGLLVHLHVEERGDDHRQASAAPARGEHLIDQILLDGVAGLIGFGVLFEIKIRFG